MGRLEITGDGRGLVVIALVGAFDLQNVGALSDCLASVVIAGQRAVTIDLARTNVIDSAAIGAPITALRSCAGRRRLRTPPRSFRRVPVYDH
jgi:anti-anti-sigma regulatory factor